MDEITRAEHEEFRNSVTAEIKRVDAENERQNKRLDLVEGAVSETKAISANVERLAVSMEHMAREQEKQGQRLEKLEGKDSTKYSKIWTIVITAVVSVLCSGIVGSLMNLILK